MKEKKQKHTPQWVIENQFDNIRERRYTRHEEDGTKDETKESKTYIAQDGEKYTFRTPALADLPALRTLHRELFPVQYKESFFTSLVTNKKNIFSMVAVHEQTKKLVGVCTSRLLKKKHYKWICWEHYTVRIGYIMTLGVTATHQRKGLASKMLRYTLRVMGTRKKCHQIQLHCKIDNEKAIQFYKKSNFNIQERIENYYRIQGQLGDAYKLTYQIVPEKELKPPPAHCCEQVIDIAFNITEKIYTKATKTCEACLTLILSEQTKPKDPISPVTPIQPPPSLTATTTATATVSNVLSNSSTTTTITTNNNKTTTNNNTKDASETQTTETSIITTTPIIKEHHIKREELT